jgi:hypothetical protein
MKNGLTSGIWGSDKNLSILGEINEEVSVFHVILLEFPLILNTVNFAAADMFAT